MGCTAVVHRAVNFYYGHSQIGTVVDRKLHSIRTVDAPLVDAPLDSDDRCPPSSEFSSEFSNAQNETHCIVEFTDDEPK